MKRMMLALCVVLLGSVLNLNPSSALAAPGTVVTVSSEQDSVHIGDEFKVQVHAEQFEDLFGVEASVQYDSAILSVVQYSLNDAYSDYGTSTNDAESGQLYFAMTRNQYEASPQSSTQLVEITFKAIKRGVSSVQVDEVIAVNSQTYINAQGKEDLQQINAEISTAISIQVKSRSSDSTGSAPTGGASTDIPVVIEDIAAETDPMISADRLTALLSEVTPEQAELVKEELLEAAASIVNELSQIPVDIVNAGQDTFTISAKDLDAHLALIADIRKSLSALNIDVSSVDLIKPQATVAYESDDRDANKLGLYQLDEATGEWKFVWQAVQNENDHSFSFPVEQAGTYRVMEFSKPYQDMHNVYAAAQYAIEVLTAQHIIAGTSDTEFSPNKEVTRAEFSAMIVRALMQDQTIAGASSSLSDVSDSAWYTDYVATMQNLGIVNGFEDGSFRPNDPVTREQMVVILMNAYKALNLGSADSDSSANQSFNDDSSISSWAKDAVNLARSMNLISGTGDNEFNPKSYSKRADTAVFIWNMLQILK